MDWTKMSAVLEGPLGEHGETDTFYKSMYLISKVKWIDGDYI